MDKICWPIFSSVGPCPDFPVVQWAARQLKTQALNRWNRHGSIKEILTCHHRHSDPCRNDSLTRFEHRKGSSLNHRNQLRFRTGLQLTHPAIVALSADIGHRLALRIASPKKLRQQLGLVIGNLDGTTTVSTILSFNVWPHPNRPNVLVGQLPVVTAKNATAKSGAAPRHVAAAFSFSDGGLV